MANMLYDIPLGNRFSLSIGAGVGVDRTSFNWPGFGGGFSDEDWRLAGQGILGLNYALDTNCDFFADYRYLEVSGPTYRTQNYRLAFEDVSNQTATLGLRYHFTP